MASLSEDMARNPMAVVQAVARPNLAGVVHPTVGGMTPDDPSFRQKIPPPEPMSPVEAALIEEEKRRRDVASTPGDVAPSGAGAVSQLTHGAASPSTFRLLVTCARKSGYLIVGLESAPDWDVTNSWLMTTEAAHCVAVVVRALGIKVKDMSGGELWGPNGDVSTDQGPTVQNTDPRGPRDGAGDLPNMRGAGTDHARESVDRAILDGAASIIEVAPGSPTDAEFLENARRQYEEELAKKQSSEARPDGGEDPLSPDHDREDTLRRRLGLSPRPPGPGGLRLPAGGDQPLPGGSDPVADGQAEADTG